MKSPACQGLFWWTSAIPDVGDWVPGVQQSTQWHKSIQSHGLDNTHNRKGRQIDHPAAVFSLSNGHTPERSHRLGKGNRVQMLSYLGDEPNGLMSAISERRTV